MYLKFTLSLAALTFSTFANASTVTINDSAYNSSSYFVSQASTTQETHIIGVYETRSDSSYNYHPEGIAYVSVTGSATRPVNLVLSSYEPTNWVLAGDGLSFVDSILVNGYHLSRVTGFDNLSVLNQSGPGNYISACGYWWPSSTGGCDTPSLVNGVELNYGEQITTFSGAYRATSFTVALSPVPEPETALLMGLGLGTVFLFVRRRTSRSIQA